MNRYQVLWIDDDAEKQDGFLDAAYLNGLDINYCKTSKLGMEELTSKIEQYDAVILDAMVYNESEDEKAALTGLFNSIKKINALSERNCTFSPMLNVSREEAVVPKSVKLRTNRLKSFLKLPPIIKTILNTGINKEM